MLDRAYMVAVRFWPFLWGGGLVAGADHLLAVVLLVLPNVDWDSTQRVGATLGLALAADFAAACALLGVFQGLIFPTRPVSAKAILRTALRKFAGYFLTHLLYVIAVAFFGLLGLRLMRAGMYTDAALGNALVGGGLVVLAAVLAVRLCLASIACLIEDGNPVGALRRSWHLTGAWPRGFREAKSRPLGRILSVLALPLLAAGLVLVAGLGLGVYGFGVPWPGMENSRETSIMMELIAFGAVAVAMPLVWAGLMAVYVEYRMRTEALDFYLRLRELSRDVPGGGVF